jgi:hypothetical protein
VISAPGGERDRLFAYLLQRQCCTRRYLAIDGPDLQRRSAFAQCLSLSGHATLRKIIKVQRQSKLIINIFPQSLGVGLT